MKLNLLDAYTIRARLSSSIILLSPIIITVFLCFNEMFTIVSSSILLFIFLAFTNYIPILQRRIKSKEPIYPNYAVQFLSPSDNTIDRVSKNRFYNKLVKVDESFSCFQTPDDSDDFQKCCISAVQYLRTVTRDNHLVQEENINYGFIKNLLESKPIGITLSLIMILVVLIYSFWQYDTFYAFSIQSYFAFSFNGILLLFWIFGVNEKVVEIAAKHYAKTLLAAIDSLI